MSESKKENFQAEQILDSFDIVLALLYILALKSKSATRTHIHLALYLASKRLKRFNEALEFIKL
jgi:hypothetical protein